MHDDEATPKAICYPVRNVAATSEQVEAAREFVDTAARIDQSGKCFEHLCVLLGDAWWHREARVGVANVPIGALRTGADSAAARV